MEQKQTSLDITGNNIIYGKAGATNKLITKNILKEFRDSQTIKDMQDAFKYYNVENVNIENKTRDYYDEEGTRHQNLTLANTKSKSAQFRKSVNQKIDFSMAKPFVLSCDNDKYLEAWEDWLDDEKLRILKRCGKEAIMKGICFIYPYIDELGELQIMYTIPETIYPAWADLDHTKLDAVVRDYIITEYENVTAKQVRKVEFWDKQIVEKFIDLSDGEGSGDLIDDLGEQYAFDENISEIQTHLTTKDGVGISWDCVPFIPFKGVEDEMPLLKEMRSDIDSYDLIKSKGIDSILDDIDAVLVVEGIGAEMGELSRARQMVKNSRIMAVDVGGKAYFEKVDINIDSILKKLELLKKDMQDNTSTVDLTTIQFGNNPSGEAMRAFFEDLNTWTNGFETEFRFTMKKLKYFFDKWLSWKGGYGTFEQLQDIKITFTLDRDMMINETSILDNIVKMKGIVSQETLDEQNPWVESHEKEQERREQEDELMQFENDIEQDKSKLNEDIDEEKQELEEKEQIKDEE